MFTSRLPFVLLLAVGLASLLAGSADASISYTTPGATESQNFNTLAASGSPAWSNDSTLTGWHLFDKSSAAITAYSANDGGSNSGSFYSYGTAGSGERALGGLGSGGGYFGSPASGAIAGWIAVSVTNATGGLLSAFTIGFDGEQWRNGGNATAQTMVLEYGFGSSFGAVSSWTAPGGTFDWTSPVHTTTAAALDGNSAGLVAGRGGTVSSLSWADGNTLWIRWVERNDTGSDHGLAIDNFSFSAEAAAVVPEPTTLLIWSGIGLVGLGIAALHKKVA